MRGYYIVMTSLAVLFLSVIIHEVSHRPIYRGEIISMCNIEDNQYEILVNRIHEESLDTIVYINRNMYEKKIREILNGEYDVIIMYSYSEKKNGFYVLQL